MNIHSVPIGNHIVRYANDTAPGEPDAWKYKIDHGMWSPPFADYGKMMDAAYLDATRDFRGSWTAHPEIHANGKW